MKRVAPAESLGAWLKPLSSIVKRASRAATLGAGLIA
jgi:hypothetical protein